VSLFDLVILNLFWCDLLRSASMLIGITRIQTKFESFCPFLFSCWRGGRGWGKCILHTPC